MVIYLRVDSVILCVENGQKLKELVTDVKNKYSKSKEGVWYKFW